MNTATEADDTNPDLKEKAARAVLDWKTGIEKILLRGIQTGEFRDGLDLQRISLSIIALLEGAVLIVKVTGKTDYKTSILQTIELIILQLKS